MATSCLIKLVCPFCDVQDSFAQIQKVHDHCRRKHDILLPPRSKSDQPPKDSKKYTKDLHDAHPSIPVKLGCPCCYDLLTDRSTLATHVIEEHNALSSGALHESSNARLSQIDDANSPGSLSSVEDMPWRTTRTLIDVSEDTGDDDMKWHFGSLDVGSFLQEFRKKSIVYNETKKHKELSLARILSIHHVYYFPLDKDKSCVAYLPEADAVNEVYDGLRIDPVILPVDVVLWATDIQQAIETGDRFVMEKEFGSLLMKSSESKKDNLVDTAHVLISLTRMMLAHKKVPKRGAEDTFVHRFVAPLIDNVFYGDKFGSYWANTQLGCTTVKTSVGSLPSRAMPLSSSSASSPAPSSASSSSPVPASQQLLACQKLQPDFTLYSSLFGHRLDLFVVEIKPPQSSLAMADFVKLTKEMMNMVNRLALLHVTAPRVFGLWVDGYHCQTYMMDTHYHSMYRMIELDTFDLPKVLDDLPKIRSVMQKLMKVKSLLDATVLDIDRLIRKRKSSSQACNSSSTSSPPQSHWIKTPLNDRKVKKEKRSVK